MTPKISVIVPIYNVENYLQRCVDSILSQSFIDFELLLINDGSPDNSGKICDEYAEKDNRVRVFHKPNGGVSSARNLGLDNALGEWIAFVDSDDYVDVDYLQELHSFALAYSADFVVMRYPNSVQTSNRVNYLTFKEFNLLFTDYQMYHGPGPVAKLFKANLIAHKCLRFKLGVEHGEDSIFVFQYLLETKDVVLIISEKYLVERNRPGSLSKTISSFESELLGKREFEGICALMKAKMFLKNDGIANLTQTEIGYTDRVLISIACIPDRRDRLKKYSELDLSYYCSNKKSHSWREGILVHLIKNKMFYLYDFLMQFYFMYKR